MTTFARRDVQRAFRKFNDTVSDLFRADFRTWGDTLNRLLDHCEKNNVMSVVVGPLKKNTQINVQSWHQDAMETIGGMIGSGRFTLPLDDEDRTALLYQFLLAIDKNEIAVDKFCMHFFGKTNYQEMVDVFNQEIVEKFTREIGYRLEEIEEDVAGQETIELKDLIVFNHYDQSTVVHGTVTGGNVNIGSGSITARDVTINSVDDLVKAFNALKHELDSDVARNACDRVIREVTGDNDSNLITEAVNEIARSEPNKAGKLKEVLERIGTSLIASTVFHSIKTSLGH